MNAITVGRIRGLQQITTPEGIMIILALDHRGSLARMLGISEADPGAYQAIRDFKLTVLEALLPHASAVLTDVQYCAAEAITSGVLPGSKGLITSLEQSGYVGPATARRTALLSGWSAAKAKRMGASAAKLLIYYNPDNRAVAEEQERLAAQVIAEAHAADLPLLLEALLYSHLPGVAENSEEFALERPRLMVKTARRLSALKPDALKLEFPHDARFVQDEAAWAEACAAVTEAAQVPWAVLSGGVDCETFKRQLRIACQAGASGYVAGRTFWQEAARLPEPERAAFLRTTATERLVAAAEIARQYGRPWTATYGDLASSIRPGWYQSY
jgi:tagatose-1,6-bisphosphate aldolase